MTREATPIGQACATFFALCPLVPWSWSAAEARYYLGRRAADGEANRESRIHRRHCQEWDWSRLL